MVFVFLSYPTEGLTPGYIWIEYRILFLVPRIQQVGAGARLEVSSIWVKEWFQFPVCLGKRVHSLSIPLVRFG